MLEKLFHLKKHKTNIKTEFVAGLTTFLTMSYVLAVNPNVLGVTGMDKGAIFVSTCVAAIVGTLIMALVANWPVGLAPGMGLNGFFAYTVVVAMGYSWQQALGAVFVSGIIFLILTIIGARKWITDGVPQSLRRAITAGVGLFLAIIALKNAGIIEANNTTLVTLGNIAHTGPLLTISALLLITILNFWRVKGAIFLGIGAVTIISFFLQPQTFTPLLQNGFVSLPPSIAPTFLQLDILGALHIGIGHVLLIFVLVELLDATGSLISVGMTGNLLEPGKPNKLNRALFADSCAIVAGSLIGTSSTTAYVESSSGIEEGGKTGLTALFVAFFFFLALFFAPLILAIPATATSAALLFIGCLMVKQLAHVDWKDLTEAIPVSLTAMMMPMTYSIANGLAFGFISYTILKIFTGQAKCLKLPTVVIAILFIIRYIVE